MSIFKRKKKQSTQLTDARGIVFEFSDGRKGIIFKDQPLKSENKIIIHLVDDEIKLKRTDKGAPITLTRRFDHAYIITAKTIGFVKSPTS